MAERYEVLGDIYKLIIPIYEYSRDFDVSILYNYLHMYIIEFLKLIKKIIRYVKH